MSAIVETATGADRLRRWLAARGPVVALVGAGLSTESGIPDYRGATGRSRSNAPMTGQAFLGSAEARQRYWARSFLGWPVMAAATPNAGHVALAELERAGRVSHVVTQNVDGLHARAGSAAVTELHGSLHRVRCLGCGALSARAELQDRLAERNPGWSADAGDVYADGDAAVKDAAIAGFHVVACGCGGALKPDVVFFGETVPAPRVATAFDAVEAAGGLLVLGSSLTVMSGYRFVLRAAKLGIGVAIVNQGSTRGDGHAELLVDAPLGEVLPSAAGLGVPA